MNYITDEDTRALAGILSRINSAPVPPEASKSELRFDQRSFNQVLASLRLWQRAYPDPRQVDIHWDDYFSDEGYTPMSAEEIDKLCERINFIPAEENKHQ